MTNQEAIRRLTYLIEDDGENGINGLHVDAIDAGIKALRDLEEAKELLMEITDYDNPGFLIPKIEKFLGKLE